MRTSYNKKTYKIFDVDFDKSPKDTFKRKNKTTGLEEEISYADYLQQQYKVKVKDMNQPMIIVLDPKKEDW